MKCEAGDAVILKRRTRKLINRQLALIAGGLGSLYLSLVVAAVAVALKLRLRDEATFHAGRSPLLMGNALRAAHIPCADLASYGQAVS